MPTISEGNDMASSVRFKQMPRDGATNESMRIHGLFHEERLKTIRRWLITELIIIDILISINYLPKLSTQPLHAKIMIGLFFLCSVILLIFIVLSYKNPARWLHSIGYLIQVIILQKEIMLA